MSATDEDKPSWVEEKYPLPDVGPYVVRSTQYGPVPKNFWKWIAAVGFVFGGLLRWSGADLGISLVIGQFFLIFTVLLKVFADPVLLAFGDGWIGVRVGIVRRVVYLKDVRKIRYRTIPGSYTESPGYISLDIPWRPDLKMSVLFGWREKWGATLVKSAKEAGVPIEKKAYQKLTRKGNSEQSLIIPTSWFLHLTGTQVYLLVVSYLINKS